MSIHLIAPDTAYELERDPDAGAWIEGWVVFAPEPDWTTLLVREESAGGIHVAPLNEHQHGAELIRVIRDALALSTPAGPWASAFIRNTVERVLLLGAGRDGGALRAPHIDPRVRRVMDAMRQDCAAAWTVESAARMATLSPSRFAHVFTAQVGEAPLHHLSRLRLDRAEELLLTTSLPVSEVARLVGYADALHFSSRFAAATGLSPTRFRGAAPTMIEGEPE